MLCQASGSGRFVGVVPLPESGLTVASTIGEAAGLQGRHQWGLILPSSARVSLLAFQTVVAVRYPGLVHTDQGIVSYGRFFTADVTQAGGFLPIVWDVPGTDMEAADAVAVVTKYLRTLFEFGPEAADSLTVLHDRHQHGPGVWQFNHCEKLGRGDQDQMCDQLCR